MTVYACWCVVCDCYLGTPEEAPNGVALGKVAGEPVHLCRSCWAAAGRQKGWRLVVRGVGQPKPYPLEGVPSDGGD